MAISIKDIKESFGSFSNPSVGDLVVAFAYRSRNTGTEVETTVAPTVPSAGGTVPQWNTLTNNTGNGFLYQSNSMTVAWTKLTATNNTEGNWSDSSFVTFVLISGHDSTTPIGGYAEQGGSDTTNLTAPSVTMSKTDGNSLLLHCTAWRSTSATFGSAPSGYTSRYTRSGTATSSDIRVFTKNTTTSDGSVTQTVSPSIRVYRAATVEVVAPSAQSGFFAMFR